MGKGKNKCILFKKGSKHHPALNTFRNENKIKQYSVVEYLGCFIDENMCGKSMAKRALKYMQKQNLFISRVGTNHNLFKEYYVTV